MKSAIDLQSIKRLLPRPHWALRDRAMKAQVWLGHATKAFVMLAILRPAANWLPRAWGLWLAKVVGSLYTVLPFFGRQKCRVLSRTLASDPQEGRRRAREVFSRHYLDFVMTGRPARGRENVETWPVREIKPEIMDSLRRSNSPYIIATGHFARHAFMPLYLPRVIPQKIVSVVNPAIPKSLDPHKLWLRAHYGQMLEYLTFARPDMELLSPGSPNLFKQLLRSIREPNHATIVFVDAPWDRNKLGTIVRPFAGIRSAAFATGTARMARLTQCPIVLCLPYIESNGEIVIEWTKLINPPDPDDAEADIVTTNILLDDIECAVGLRPGQYVMNMFGERRWDTETRRWE